MGNTSKQAAKQINNLLAFREMALIFGIGPSGHA
jgi:hypothetical protein